MNTILKVLSILSVFSIINLVQAGESGLLLGLRVGGHYDTAATLDKPKRLENSQESVSYRTFWFSAQDGKIELVAERTNLLVPREDGFWRVDVKQSSYNNFKEDFIWINPAPDPDAIPNPILAEQEGVNAFDVSLLVKEQGIEMPAGEYCNGHAYRDILFIGINYMSVGYVRSQLCNGSVGISTDSALQMFSLDEFKPVNISSLVEAQEGTVFFRTAKEYQDQSKDKNSQEWGDFSGGVVRQPGKWVVKGHFPIKKDNYTHFDVPITPSQLVEYGELHPDWETIKQLVPEAIDAFSSPTQDWLVVLTKTGLLGFTLNETGINSKPVLQLYLKQPVTAVMAHWAEGLRVMNWSEEIQNIGPNPRKSWITEIPLSPGKGQTIGVIVCKTPTLNIRQGMGQHTKPIGKVKKGAKLPVLNVLGSWYQVKVNEDVSGYVHRNDFKILPSLPYIQTGCPMSNCNYGTWKLKQATLMYAKPSLQSESVTKLEPMQVVEALTGEIHTARYGEIEVVNAIELNEDNQKLALQPGDRLFDLESIGLGMHTIWYNGEIYYLSNGWDPDTAKNKTLWGKELIDRQTDWWVRINVPEKNLTGWIVNPFADGITTSM
ncbi:MAG: SH3 domain-containing protein [Thioploca sp.]|nr:SH3 domain-containing protein [Thioploca sp.]